MHTTMRDHQPAIDVVCRGGPRTMGVQQGEALRARIVGAEQALGELEAFRLQKPPWIPFAVFRRMAMRKAARFVRDGLETVDGDSFQRLSGVAEGSGVRFSSMCLLNAMEAVMSDLTRTTAVPAAAACSAVAVAGPTSKSGEALVAHNFDYLPVVQPFYSVRESRPEGGLRSLEFLVAPLCGAVDGVNEAGLCITYNYAYSVDHAGPAPTISMWIARALANCRNVPQAVELISTGPRWGGGLLMLADEQGRTASLELANTACRLREPDDGGVLFHTNRFQSDAMSNVELDPSAVYADKAPAVLRGRRVHRSSECREARFRARLADSGPMDAGDVAGIMADHGEDGSPSDRTICMHGDYWFTTACVQLFPRERKMRIAYDTACQAKYSEIELG